MTQRWPAGYQQTETVKHTYKIDINNVLLLMGGRVKKGVIFKTLSFHPVIALPKIFLSG